MPSYDFKTLSSHDFEDCARDLLQAELSIRLESFKSGRDGGIDLRHSRDSERSLIVQCKHYAEFGYDALLRDLKKELPKVKKIKPARYLIATSVGLSPMKKDEIVGLFSPYCVSPSEVFGKEDLNNLLGRHPEVEKKNFKLWLSSSLVLNRILHSKIYNYSDTEVERIKRKIKLYVQNDSFFRALKILEDLHYCIIAGIPGIGKTTLAEILLVHHLRLGYEPIKIANDITEAYAVLNQGRRQIFYYDDFLGQTVLEDKLNKNEDESLLRFLDTVRRSKTTKLILTTREYILAHAKASYEKLSVSSFDYKKCVVDLGDYTEFHRAKILYNHVYFSSLKKEYLAALLEDRSYMRVVGHRNFNPRIIEWMTDYVESQGVTSSGYVERFVSSLDNPTRLWQHAFEKQLANPSRHVLLTLVSMPDEVVLEDLEKAFTSLYLYRSKQCRFPIDSLDFKQALKELESNFIRIDKSGDSLAIKFHNPSIRDFLVNVIRDDNGYAEDLVRSAVFFEQIVRLWGGGVDVGGPARTRRALEGMGKDLGEALERLLDSADCRLVVPRAIRGRIGTSAQRVALPLETRAIYALDIASQLRLKAVSETIFSRLVERILSGPNRWALDVLIEQIVKRKIQPPSTFTAAVKDFLLSDLSGLDEFESVADFSSRFPASFSEEELEALRVDFEVRCGRLVDVVFSNVSDPDELRRYAGMLKDLGDEFGVDVKSEYDSLKEQASEIEGSYHEGDPGDYESWKDAAAELDRREDEIHSMFDSLKE